MRVAEFYRVYATSLLNPWVANDCFIFTILKGHVCDFRVNKVHDLIEFWFDDYVEIFSLVSMVII